MTYDPQGDTACVCRLLLFISVCVALAGVYLLHLSSLHTRAHAVMTYGEVVQQWTDHVRVRFREASFTLQTNLTRKADDRRNTNEGVLIHLTTNASTELLPDRGSDLLAYEPLRYERVALLLPHRTSWVEEDVRLTLVTRAPGSSKRCTFELGGAEGLPVAYRQAWPYSRAECGARLGGSYNPSSGQCTCFYAVSEVCIKVSLMAGCLTPDASGGGVGCEPGKEGLWSPVRYKRLKGARAVGAPSFHRDPPQHIGRPTLRVRHSADPMISAHNLTHDRLDFGIGDGVKALGGIELLMCAIALGLPAVYFFLRRMRGSYDGSDAPPAIFTRIFACESVAGEDEMMEATFGCAGGVEMAGRQLHVDPRPS
jgi:hypothetical protein